MGGGTNCWQSPVLEPVLDTLIEEYYQTPVKDADETSSTPGRQATSQRGLHIGSREFYSHAQYCPVVRFRSSRKIL